jgi:hypothetical protein
MWCRRVDRRFAQALEADLVLAELGQDVEGRTLTAPTDPTASPR